MNDKAEYFEAKKELDKIKRENDLQGRFMRIPYSKRKK